MNRAQSVREQVGPLGALIAPIDRADSPLLPDVGEILTRLFPAYARYRHILPYWADNRGFIEHGVLSHVWLVQVDGRAAGLRIFHYLSGHNLGFGAFIGVLPEFSGAGVGQWLQAMTLAQVAADARQLGRPEPVGCFSEIENAGAAEGRLAFFQRFGGVRLDATYLEPPMIVGLEALCGRALEGIGPRPMDLVFYPLRASDQPAAIDPQFVLDAVYREYYRLP